MDKTPTKRQIESVIIGVASSGGRIEIFEISLLDVVGDEMSQSQIKAELSLSGSEMDEQHFESNNDTGLNTHHQPEGENFASIPPLTYFKSEDEDECTQEAINEDISDKLKVRYTNTYELFIKWQESKGVNSFAEPVLLEYFHELSTKYKPPTLWAMYLMLKRTMMSNQNINITGYRRLSVFLRKRADGYRSKKTKVFTAEDVNKFLVEAPDDKYLAMKTVLIFGVTGVSIVEKMTHIKADYVKDNGNEIIARIPDPKTNDTKVFVIDGKYAEIVRKYMRLRPISATTDRFLMQYQNGKCINQVIGRETAAKIPKEIAKFLNLAEFGAYTGQSFRSTLAAISADTVGIETRHEEVAEENEQESLGHKRKIGIIAAAKVNSPSTSSESSWFEQDDISENSSLSESEERSDSNDDTARKRHQTKAPTHKKEKRSKKQEEMNWYDEECQTQIKLTTDMFKRFSNLAEENKIQMLSEFSMHRLNLSKNLFAAMNTPTTAS